MKPPLNPEPGHAISDVLKKMVEVINTQDRRIRIQTWTLCLLGGSQVAELLHSWLT